MSDACDQIFETLRNIIKAISGFQPRALLSHGCFSSGITIDWVAYQPWKFISHSSGCWESRLLCQHGQVPMRTAFQGCRWGLFRPAAKSGNRVFKWFALPWKMSGEKRRLRDHQNDSMCQNTTPVPWQEKGNVHARAFQRTEPECKGKDFHSMG